MGPPSPFFINPSIGGFVGKDLGLAGILKRSSAPEEGQTLVDNCLILTVDCYLCPQPFTNHSIILPHLKPISSRHKYLTDGRFGSRLGAGHEDTQESHHDQMDFIQGTAFILLGDILQAEAEAQTPMLPLSSNKTTPAFQPEEERRLQ